MSNEPNDPIFVDPNTDDLDSFTNLLEGRAEVKTEEKVETVKVEDSEDDEDTNLQNDDNDNDSDGDDDDGVEDKVEDKPKKVNRFQERINELTAKAKEAERAYDALKAEKAKEQTEPTKQTTQAVQDDEPDYNALNPDGSDKYPLGQYDPMYARDLARYSIAKEWSVLKEQEAAEQNQRSIEASRAELQNQWVEKLTPITEQHEDFLDKTMQLESAFDGLDPNYIDYLVQTIKSLDHGPEVLYYFANNLDEAQKFVKMGALSATLALGEINAMFKGQTRKPDPKVSQAPPPPQVNKGSKTRTSFRGDTDDLDDFDKVFFKKS